MVVPPETVISISFIVSHHTVRMTQHLRYETVRPNASDTFECTIILSDDDLLMIFSPLLD